MSLNVVSSVSDAAPLFSENKSLHAENHDCDGCRGGRKKDRFHLLRDLWEIMGVVVLLLRKENICWDLPRVRLVLSN